MKRVRCPACRYRIALVDDGVIPRHRRGGGARDLCLAGGWTPDQAAQKTREEAAP